MKVMVSCSIINKLSAKFLAKNKQAKSEIQEFSEPKRHKVIRTRGKLSEFNTSTRNFPRDPLVLSTGSPKSELEQPSEHRIISQAKRLQIRIDE